MRLCGRRHQADLAPRAESEEHEAGEHQHPLRRLRVCRNRELESAAQRPGRPRNPRGELARTKKCSIEVEARKQRRRADRSIEAREQVEMQTGDGRRAHFSIWPECDRAAGYRGVTRVDREIEDICERN